MIKIIIYTLCTFLPLWGEVKTWTSRAGTTVRAEFVSYKDQEVTLMTAQGEKIVLKDSLLSQDDLELILPYKQVKALAPKLEEIGLQSFTDAEGDFSKGFEKKHAEIGLDFIELKVSQISKRKFDVELVSSQPVDNDEEGYYLMLYINTDGDLTNGYQSNSSRDGVDCRVRIKGDSFDNVYLEDFLEPYFDEKRNRECWRYNVPSELVKIRRTKLKKGTLEFKLEFLDDLSVDHLEMFFYTVKDESVGKEDVFLDELKAMVKVNHDLK